VAAITITMTTTATTTNQSSFELAAFRRALMSWYRANGRHDLPWRLTRDPYAILVSEVMLQQTQVSRVLPYYTGWLERWPTFEALAEASPAEVIRAWRGLGYNRRGLNLHRVAQTVVAEHGGTLPGDAMMLRRLPGIGPYTASAVGSFAHEQPVVVADTNIARVVARVVLGAANQREAPPRTLNEALEGLLPVRSARDHNLALMDLGATVCLARSPECRACPVRRGCSWLAAGKPAGTLAKAPQPKFESTARFARGRIIDALRESPALPGELAAMLPARHAAKLGTYLCALERDGLVVRDGEAWRLPG
jgi:A/G-specific adenine glycosylase